MLGVLDGVVLVVSAVEGVQPQTRVLMRTLQRLRIPTLLFVNKLDRRGADGGRVLGELAERLTPAVVAMGSVTGLGTRGCGFVPYGAADAAFTARLADLLADHDEALLAAYLDDEAALPYRRLRRALRAQTGRALVHPVFFGSAITGAGVDALTAGITELLPPTAGDAGGPVSGSVFKVERGPAGEKVAYLRMFSGTVRVRDRLAFSGRHGGHQRRVTAISVFERGRAVRRASVAAGQIAKLWGLAEVQIGDTVGGSPAPPAGGQFAPPTLETVVVPRRPADRGALHAALAQLAEQDPLIDLRQDDLRQEISVSLYGEVQKEVVQATLAADYGLEVRFRESTTLCIERPVGSGAAVERIGQEPNPFLATVGLRVDPGPGRQRGGVPARGRARVDAVRVLRGRRGDRARDPRPGAARLAGDRLRGHHDPLRLLAPAEPRPRHLRQEHVEHGPGLPPADPAGPDGRPGRGRHPGAGADAPLPARAPGRHPGRGPGCPGRAGGRAPGDHPAGGVVPWSRARSRPPGSTS